MVNRFSNLPLGSEVSTPEFAFLRVTSWGFRVNFSFKLNSDLANKFVVFSFLGCVYVDSLFLFAVWTSLNDTLSLSDESFGGLLV